MQSHRPVRDEAVKLLNNSETKYRALVTAIQLGLGTLIGWGVARHARSSDPELAIVYMTGDSAAEWASEGRAEQCPLTQPLPPHS
jgi:hypothetical protein